MILRKKAIKAINDTIFYPKKVKKDYYLWLKEGLIGVFQDKEFGEFLYQFLLIKKQKNLLRDQKVIDRIASIYEKQGSDCWFTDDLKFF